MLKDQLEAGQHFHWSSSEDGTGGEAVVESVRTDRELGLSSESDQYVALWLTATGVVGSRVGQSFEILLGTDGKSYLEGKVVLLRVGSHTN